MDTSPNAPSLDAFGTVAASTEAPPKPAAVLLLQILCVVAIVIELGMAGMAFWSYPSGRGMLFMKLFSLAFDSALIVWLGCALLGAQRGESYGRLLGLSVLVVLTLICVGTLYSSLPNAGGPFSTGRMAGSGLGLVFTALWIHAFGFAKDARAWFDQARGVEVHLHGWDA